MRHEQDGFGESAQIRLCVQRWYGAEQESETNTYSPALWLEWQSTAVALPSSCEGSRWLSWPCRDIEKVNTALWGCGNVCVCLWSLVVKGKKIPTLSRFECNNFACLQFEIWSLQSVAGTDNRLHSWLETKIQIFQFPLWPKKHTLLKTLISIKWCLLVSLKLLMCLSGFSQFRSMQLLSNFPKKQIKNTSWMPDSASFDKFWSIFQNLCLFFFRTCTLLTSYWDRNV